jgi:hypothetical protein
LQLEKNSSSSKYARQQAGPVQAMKDYIKFSDGGKVWHVLILSRILFEIINGTMIATKV